MGNGVEKKKKGRPSLLDLQKRNLILEHQQQQQKRNPNPNPISKPNFRNEIVSNPNPNRRSTRRNRNPEGIAEETERIEAVKADDDEDEDDLNGQRKEKKLKLVLRSPSHQLSERSSVNFPYLNSGSCGFDSNAEDENGETKLKNINAVGDGSTHCDAEKGENQNSPSKATDAHLGTSMESGPTIPLPDQKLLIFILDRLQKKDTYRVYSEPVDPKELPDYHEIIEHPMDFGTVRKKLDGGAYSNLEHFEKDVFLICSNAMQYNAPDTIYFRQARSIQELAKKSFENLRQDSDNNKPEPKIVRRGRPPTKNLKKPLGKATIEHAGSEFSSDVILATRGENAIFSNSYDLRKGPRSDKYGPVDASGRAFHGSHNSVHTGWLAEHKSERNGEFPGYMLKGLLMKFEKKQFVMDENRRDTYKHSHPYFIGYQPSVLTTFDGEKKQLMTVGLHTEHGYARSLARFSANLGPIAWKIASKKIERALPGGIKFGPGWVVENEAPPKPPRLMPSLSGQLPLGQPFHLPKITSSTATEPIMVESNGDKFLEKQELPNNSVLDGLPSITHPPCAIASSFAVVNTPPEPTTERTETARGLSNESGIGLMCSSGIRHPFQIHQSPVLNPGMNCSSRGVGVMNMVSQNNFVHSTSLNCSENPKPSGSPSTINSGTPSQNSSHEAHAGSRGRHRQQPSWQGLSLQKKPDSVPPDLNIRFKTSGSPNSRMQVDSPQPDLALQL